MYFWKKLLQAKKSDLEVETEMVNQIKLECLLGK